MEQGTIFSPRPGGLSAEEIVRRLGAAPPPRRRRSPLSPAEIVGDPDLPRGDHDLNPEFYEPGRALTRAAVLVPIVARRPGATVLLTRRTEHLNDHAGQISFPGGRIEPSDKTAEAAALREAEEEVGLPPTSVRLIGRLDTYVTRTGFEVMPMVGLVEAPVTLAPDDFEVAEVFEVPLGFFLDPANRQTQSRVWQGKERHFYAYPYGAYFIWGATAGMLVNLAEVLGEPC